MGHPSNDSSCTVRERGVPVEVCRTRYEQDAACSGDNIDKGVDCQLMPVRRCRSRVRTDMDKDAECPTSEDGVASHIVIKTEHMLTLRATEVMLELGVPHSACTNRTTSECGEEWANVCVPRGCGLPKLVKGKPDCERVSKIFFMATLAISSPFL